MTMKYRCPNCGSPIKPGESFCRECGANLIQYQQSGIRQTNRGKIIAIAAGAVTFLLLFCVLVLPRLLNSSDTAAASKNHSSETENTPEPTAEPTPSATPTSEPEQTRVDLTGSLENIHQLHTLLNGDEVTDKGQYEYRYQREDLYAYGSAPGNDAVWDMWLKTGQYELYGCYVGQTLSDFEKTMSEAGWQKEALPHFSYGYSKGDIHLEAELEVGAVSQLAYYKDIELTQAEEPAEEEAEEDPFLIPYSSTRELTEADLYGFSARELTIARNEIYARHGYIFQSRELREYFNEQSWYTEDPTYTEARLSALDIRNAVFIRDYQNDNGMM
jgi:predicted nucleic acid-binding Zn ribbon protein